MHMLLMRIIELGNLYWHKLGFFIALYKPQSGSPKPKYNHHDP